MRKLKLYLDTSVVSHLFADDTPEKMNETLQLWDIFINGKYDIYISALVLGEIRRCSEPRRGKMLKKMKQINFVVLSETEAVKELAREYVTGGVLREKSLDDCTHIAYAVINNCNAIVSWNFKHLVNFKTIDRVRVVNAVNRYNAISIISPTMLIEGED